MLLVNWVVRIVVVASSILCCIGRGAGVSRAALIAVGGKGVFHKLASPRNGTVACLPTVAACELAWVVEVRAGIKEMGASAGRAQLLWVGASGSGVPKQVAVHTLGGGVCT